MDKYIDDLILTYEKELLTPRVRKSTKELSKLLANNYVEFCSSGSIYNYNPKDTFYEENINYELKDFKTKMLSDNCVLATYKVKKYNLNNCKITNSIRSSIWQFKDNHWQMIFHQGTIIK